ncbi:uncharacterized protein B0H18DRAFT_998724 [Fomitopsis serialis]|uniref:uncharacterized protein n=1 Tax=Fomitopsis serialis TaxID=139415 RepID=UPI0020072C74|nr:uncharacterized protein B0H18DRAFT_998724 [Neoantrodia serialis]KAH9929268.1 hypothetical protein B0H18DRAFT_998724 [Neoantrodia serialis]
MSYPIAYPVNVDVFVVGGGPTSLVTTFLLLKSGIRVLAVEQNDYAQQAMYGRAGILHSRTLELLDMIGIYERIADIGFAIREGATYKDGREVGARGWNFMFDAVKGRTFFDFSLSIRQRHVEGALRDAVQDLDKTAIRAPVVFVDYAVDTSKPIPYALHPRYSRAVKSALVSWHSLTFRPGLTSLSKYLVGADGGHSSVRRLAGIGFPGTNSGQRWVRMDAVVETDMPYPRRGVSFESKEYGNVLWNPSDNGQMLMEEAKRAVQPFTLEFVELDWWTIYSIGQRVAERYRTGPILLAGDAAHTHSSGAGQGMNTGIHDATNLAWKLIGVLKGQFTICPGYVRKERRASHSTSSTRQRDGHTHFWAIASHYNAPPDADPTSNAAFTVGLGISYAENLLNQRRLSVGHRAPDAAVARRTSPYIGRFWISSLQGITADSTRPRLQTGCAATVDSPLSFVNALAPVFEFLTIRDSGEQPLGKTVSDEDGKCYEVYNLQPRSGGIVVVRPDGIVGLEATLDGYGVLDSYFAQVVRAAGPPHRHPLYTSGSSGWTLGEVSIDGGHGEEGLRRWIGAKL